MGNRKCIRQHFGGWIVLGVKQNGKKFEISGVDNAEKLEQDFLGTLRSQKFNEPVDAKSMLYHIDGHKVLAFHIASSPTSLSTITIHRIHSSDLAVETSEQPMVR